jgi:hypothetical protein
MAQAESWESKFARRNGSALTRVLRLFHPKSWKGQLVLGVYLHVDLFLFHIFATRGVVTTFVYLGTLFFLGVMLTNMPRRAFGWLFPAVDENLLERVDQAVLFRYLNVAHQICLTLGDLHDSLFVRCDVFTISGFSVMVFGTLLLLRKLPAYVLIHLVIDALLLAFAWMGRSLCRERVPPGNFGF